MAWLLNRYIILSKLRVNTSLTLKPIFFVLTRSLIEIRTIISFNVILALWHLLLRLLRLLNIII